MKWRRRKTRLFYGKRNDKRGIYMKNPNELVVYSANKQRKENIKEAHSYLESAFTKIDKNIDDLFEKKDEMKGVLFFKSHKYTAKDLLNSSQYNRIQSLIKKIDDDIDRWQRAKRLSLTLRSTYNYNRELLIDRMEHLQDAILNREPTWWDKVKSFFISFLEFIAKHLRVLWNGLMLGADMVKNHTILGPPARLLLLINSKIQKLLTPKKNVYITE